jgi:hypothetical protein
MEYVFKACMKDDLHKTHDFIDKDTICLQQDSFKFAERDQEQGC